MNQAQIKMGLVAVFSALLAACSSGDSEFRAASDAVDPTANSAMATSSRVTGTLSYRERMFLKPGSVVEVWLLDTSLADVPATEIAYQRIENPGQQPVRYVLEYDPADIIEGRVYSVRAKISKGDTMLFTTDTHHPALTRGAGSEVDLELVRVASAPPPDERPRKPDSSLTNTYWKLTSIGGEPFRHEGEGREPHLMLVGELRARGRTGCNSFTGGYETYADALRFDNMAVTQMACVTGMDVERQFLDALDRVDRYDINGESMVLYAGEDEVLGFAAIYF